MVLAQVARDAGLPESYFDIKKIGVLRIGIGSALSAKYLMRVEGATAAPEDDVMMEAKEVLQREGLACIQVTTGPSRIFAGEQRLAYQPFRFPGVLHVGGKTFWVHAWTDHYVELDIQKSVQQPGRAARGGLRRGGAARPRTPQAGGRGGRASACAWRSCAPCPTTASARRSCPSPRRRSPPGTDSRTRPAGSLSQSPPCTTTPNYLDLLFVFLLATFIGLGVIQRVSRLLHTPLMSLTNAISAIAVVGAIVVAGQHHPPVIVFLGAVALFASMTNIVSGFLITDRMLKMFKKDKEGRG